MLGNITVTLCINVTDEAAFRKSAYEQAIKDGLVPTEASAYLDPDEMLLSECAKMIFDPGESPSGCRIIESSCE